MSKTPPRQYTVSLESMTSHGQTEFARLLEFLKTHGVLFRDRHTHPIGKRSFSFQLRLTQTTIGKFLWIKHSAASFETAYRPTPSTAGGASPHVTRDLRLIFILAGERTRILEGQSIKLKAGDFIITESSQFERVSTTDNEVFEIIVSEDYFYTHAGFRAERFINHIFDSGTPVRRLFSRHVHLLAHDIALLDARDIANVCDGIFCFLRNVLSEQDREGNCPQSAMPKPDQLRAKAMDIMQHYVQQPDLRLDEIAEKLGISTRYLNLLFADVGTTPMAVLRDLRLKRVAIQLREDHLEAVSIEQIGLANGIPNPSHLARLFKAKYGLTPKAWRNQNSTKKV